MVHIKHDLSAIHRYWFKEEGAALMASRGIRAHEGSCFGCGFNLKLERAHIVADMDGGEATLCNLHNLCPNCHLESETLSGQDYWTWLELHHKKKYKSPLVRLDEKLAYFNSSLTDVLSEFSVNGIEAAFERLGPLGVTGELKEKFEQLDRAVRDLSSDEKLKLTNEYLDAFLH